MLEAILKKRKKYLHLAYLLAGALALSGMGVLPVTAAEGQQDTQTATVATPGTYVLNADEDVSSGDISADTSVGTKKNGIGYFTLKATTDKGIKVDTGKKEFTVDEKKLSITNRIKSSGAGSIDARSIAFTIEEGLSADITVCAVSSNGEIDATLVLLDAKGDIVSNTTTTLVPKTVPTTIWNDIKAGTYYLASDTSNEKKPVNFFYVRVAEKISVAGTVSGPNVTSVTAALDSADSSGKTAKVSFTGTDGTAGSTYVAEASKDNSTWVKAGDAEGTLTAGDISVDLSGEAFGSGTWKFRVKGKGDTETAAVVAADSITYVLPFLTKTSAKVTAGDGKLSVTWNEVREADNYKVYLYDSENGNSIQSAEVLASAEKKAAEFTGLTNGKKYWVAVESNRTTPAGSTISEKVSARPYRNADTSNAIPGLNIVNQSEAASAVILRDGASVTVAQPASEGGVSGSSRKNISFLQFPTAMTGNFSISADITVQARTMTGTGGGAFLGAVDSAAETGNWMTAAFRGDTSIKVYRDKYNNGGGSAADLSADFKNFKVGSTYTLGVERTDGVYTITLKNGSDIYTKTYKQEKNEIEVSLWNSVYPVIALCGVTADVNNIVIKDNGTEVFNSKNLTGSFTPFEDNWSMADAPVLKNIIVDNAAQTVTVTCDGEIGVTGAGQITVDMYNAAGKKVDSQSSTIFGTTSRDFTFEPVASGIYTFRATASRPGQDSVKESAALTATDNFVLKLAGLTATASNQGGGSVKVSWTEVPEATAYLVSYKAAGASFGSAKEVSGLTTIISGLTNGVTYTFQIVPVRGTEQGTETAQVDKTVENKFEPEWKFSNFGSGASNSKNGFTGDANDGSVTVYSINGGGKLVPASTDGLSFYYTEIPADKNFTLTAKVKVDEWTYSNGQEGFGLMAADAVGEKGNNSAFWNNSYMAFAGKVEYYWDADKQIVSDAGTKISMKLGIGSQEKKGVTAANISELTGDNAPDAIKKYFSTGIRTLESSCGNSGSGTYNLIGNALNAGGVEGTVSAPLTELTLTIQKNNTGYFVSYTDAAGVVTTNKYYGTDVLNQIDKDTVYAGLFASRNAEVTFTDVKVTMIDPADDAQAEEQAVTKVTPSFRIISAQNANQSAYDLVYYGNADGYLSIAKGTDTSAVIVQSEKVAANTKKVYPVSLEKGKNDFIITFTPDAAYKPDEHSVLSSYDAVTFTHSVSYSTYRNANQPIYVAPNGTSSGDGTKSNPVDIYSAVKCVQPGQTIVLGGGTYSLSSTVTVQRGISGTKDNMIYMIADPESTARPVFDFNKACAGMVFAGDYWYCQGFDVTNSGNAQKGLQISGSYSVFDDIHAYHNGNTGIQVSRFLGTDLWEDWPSNDLILNCTSYGNADAGYEDADGFAAKLTIADGIVFDGCIAYNNADDGWDLFAKPESGAIGKVVIQNCVAYGNGYLEDGTLAGNGNGFKLGGSSISGKHTLINSVSFDNKAKGIDSNSCPDIQVYQCTSVNNGSELVGKPGEYTGGNIAFYTNDAKNTDFYAEGILSFRTRLTAIGENIKLLGTQDSSKVYGSGNYYWDKDLEKSVNKEGKSVAENWFKSMTFTGIGRNADGTIDMKGYLVTTAEAPAGVGAVVGGKPSAVITVTDVEDKKDDNDDADDNDDDTPAETKAPVTTPAPAATTTKKPAAKPATSVKPTESSTKPNSAANKVTEKDLEKVAQKLETLGISQSEVEKITAAIENGKTAQVILEKTTKVPSDLFSAIKGKDVEVEFKVSDAVSWVINGSDITNPADVDLGVELNVEVLPAEELKALAGDNKTLQFSLSYDGEFGFTAELNIAVGSENDGKYGNTFYVHDGIKKYVGSGKVKDGMYKAAFSHASDYVIVFTDEVMDKAPEVPAETITQESTAAAESQSTETPAETGSSNSPLTIILIILAVLVIGGVVIAIIVPRRKKDN